MFLVHCFAANKVWSAKTANGPTIAMQKSLTIGFINQNNRSMSLLVGWKATDHRNATPKMSLEAKIRKLAGKNDVSQRTIKVRTTANVSTTRTTATTPETGSTIRFCHKARATVPHQCVNTHQDKISNEIHGTSAETKVAGQKLNQLCTAKASYASKSRNRCQPTYQWRKDMKLGWTGRKASISQPRCASRS